MSDRVYIKDGVRHEVQSSTPGAIRERNRRARQKAERLAAQQPAAVKSDAAAPPRMASIPLHEITPVSVTSPNGEPFASPVFVLHDGGGTTDEGKEGASPIIDAAPVPPPAGVTEAESRAIAKLLVQFVSFGTMLGVQKHPELVVVSNTKGTPLTGFLERGLPVALQFYEEAAVRVLLKYQIRIPFIDEGIVASGLGVAAWGLASKPSELAKKLAAQNAKDANVPAATAATVSEESEEKSETVQSPSEPVTYSVHTRGVA